MVVLARYDAQLSDLDETRRRYRDELGTLGRTVRVERANGTLVGRAVDVDDAGRLLVEVDGAVEVIAAGDVVHMRDA